MELLVFITNIAIDKKKKKKKKKIEKKATGFKSLRVSCCEIYQVILTCQMDILDKICKKRYKTEKFHHHRISHIQNRLGIKLQGKLQILSFLMVFYNLKWK